MAQSQETELIPVYPSEDLITAHFQTPVGAFFLNLPFFDPWLIRCDTQDGAEFINLNPLKMILRVNGVETLEVKNGEVWIRRGIFFSWKEIFSKIDKIFKHEGLRNISFAMALIPEETEYKRSLITTIESNIILSCFKKRASCGYCGINKIEHKEFTSFVLGLGESLIAALVVLDCVEQIILAPYTLRVATNKNTPDNEKEKIKEQIKRIIERHKEDGSFMSI